MAATEELSAPDDRTVRFRLKRPFPHLPDALAGPGGIVPVIMPERLALTSPFKPVAEIVGCGPYRFLPDEHMVVISAMRASSCWPQSADPGVACLHTNGPDETRSPATRHWASDVDGLHDSLLEGTRFEPPVPLLRQGLGCCRREMPDR